MNFWLLFLLCSSPGCHANTHTGTALCYLHTEGRVLCHSRAHTWLPSQQEELCSQTALVSWAQWPVPVPSCPANCAFPKSRMQDFQTSWETRDPHLLLTVRALRTICLPKCMPATDHKHNHSLIVLMRLQLEMPQCCCLIKEQNKHQIHLEKKKSPCLSTCRLIRFQI